MLFANVGLPMIFVELPFLAIALLPVAIVEGTFYYWRLPVSWRQAVWGALRANLWSTFVGVPFAWLAQLFCQMAVGGGAAWGMDTPLDRLAAVTAQSAWLIPYRDDLFWMIPAAAMFLMVPCLLVSIAVELIWLRSFWPDVTLRRLFVAVVLANSLSYLMLAAFWGVELILVLIG